MRRKLEHLGAASYTLWSITETRWSRSDRLYRAIGIENNALIIDGGRRLLKTTEGVGLAEEIVVFYETLLGSLHNPRNRSELEPGVECLKSELRQLEITVLERAARGEVWRWGQGCVSEPEEKGERPEEVV